MFFKIILLATLSLASSKCTNMLFVEHTTNTKQVSKTYSVTVSTALDWKDNIIHNTQSNDIFTTLDFVKYELMTHAYRGSLIIHRVCEKITDYPKYGKITTTELRGYVVNNNNLFHTDMFLSNNRFTTYRNTTSEFNRYMQQQMEKERKRKMDEIKTYNKTHPIKHFIYYILMKYLYYTVMIFGIKYIIS